VFVRIRAGTCLAGDCDEIPGVARVSTRFFHLWNLPLIPLATLLVIGKEVDEADGYRAIELPFSYKSLVLAYFRSFLGCLFLGAAVWGVSAIAFRNYSDPEWYVSVGILVGIWVFLVLLMRASEWVGRGSPARLAHLQQILDNAVLVSRNDDAARLAQRNW
jgi:hypothetical protein